MIRCRHPKPADLDLQYFLKRIYPCLVGTWLIEQALNQGGVAKNYFVVSQLKHMLWVLKRTVSMRRFF